MGNFICSDFLRRIKVNQTRVVPPELILASMQHISSFIGISPTSSLFIHNRDKRRGKLYSIIMIASLVITMSLAPVTTMAEAPSDHSTIPTTATTVKTDDSIIPTEVLPETKLVDGLTVEERAAKIDAFFAKKGNLPAAGKGIIFVTYADKYGIDWRLVASKNFIESTGFKFACKNDKYNGFGWGSCRGAWGTSVAPRWVGAGYRGKYPSILANSQVKKASEKASLSRQGHGPS
jgi:hypothetical protein